MRQNKVDELRSLSERAGFKEAVEELDISAWARDSGAVELTRAVAPLQEAGLLTGELLHEWVEDYLLPTVSTVGVWRLAGTESGRGLATIANLLPDDGARSNLLKRIEPMEADKPAVAEGSNSALQGLATLASDLEPSLVQGLRIRLAVPAESVSVLAYFRRLTESPAAWSVPVPPVNASNVSETVVTSAASNATLALQAVEVLFGPTRATR